MKYFKHSDLVTRYHVSLKTVHNWIDAAKQGKVELRLHEEKGRTYIANNPANISVLVKLSENGKKYRNSLHHKDVTPKSSFYETYSRRQILDIIHGLDIHREIPLQYNYFNEGASSWDKRATRQQHEPSTLSSTIELLHNNLGSIDFLLKGRRRVNVIDIGVGNALPVRELLAHLLERGVLARYIALDISSEMLRIAERNVSEWFGDKVKFEGHIRDISYERFDDLLVDDMLGGEAEETVNLALLLGATPVNFRSPVDILKTIYGSMGQDDLIVYTLKPDTEMSRGYFDFHNEQGKDASPKVGDVLAGLHSVLDELSIEESLYNVEMGFDEIKRMRYVRLRLKIALTISFVFDQGQRDVQLEKGDAILLWRAWHLTPLEIISDFEKVGFTLLQSSLTKDRQYLMTISGVEVKQEAGSTDE